jgi:prepilin-type N-terminal cleavage/methylation domain-containing protein
MMNINKKNGFTLIELVIIMVILGVLAAVAVPRLGSTIDSSEASAEEAIIGSLRSAIEVYAMDQVVSNSNKSYPENPFEALDDKSRNDLYNNNWQMGGFGNDGINHVRNDGSRSFWSYNSNNGEIQFGYTD